MDLFSPLLADFPKPLSLEWITKGGSGRQICRIHWVDSSAVAYAWKNDRPDNANLVPVAKALAYANVNNPSLLAAFPQKTPQMALFTDLGNIDLLSFFLSNPWPETRKFYQKSLTELAKVHSIPEENLPELQPPFDEALYHWEQEYFAQHFLTRYGNFLAQDLWQNDLPEYFLSKKTPENRQIAQNFLHSSFAKNLASELAKLPRVPIHRDFQSQNILIKDDEAWLIDFQGLRFGLAEYDLASLIWDAYLPISNSQREEILQIWETISAKPLNRELFLKCSLQRLMQMLGAFANLGNNLNKPDYLKFIAPTWRNLISVKAKLTANH